MTSYFPYSRPRRLRQASWIRDMTQEVSLSVKDLILPIFIVEGKGEKQAISSLPEVYRYSVDELLVLAKSAHKMGIPAIALFPKIDDKYKDETGSEALNNNNLVCRAVKELKSKIPEIGIICDVALDPYTNHGHDGILDSRGYVDNDVTVDALCNQALTLAEAGADVVAPSDMMDGRVGQIRDALEGNSFHNTLILSYTAKYASAFYGPFREAVGSKAKLAGSSKATYQMNPANWREALKEARQDIAEGADMLMVKPGMPYLDILCKIREICDLPLISYQVSGEYAMIKAAASNGWLDGSSTLIESLISFKRAGADAIFTYAALEAAKILLSDK